MINLIILEGGVYVVEQPINWQELTEKYKEDFLEDLQTLLKIESVRDDEQATDEFPVGPGPAKALKTFLDIGKRDGFETKQLENWAGHIEYGEGNETLGILGHVDVVPAGSGWDTDPFKPEFKGGRIYARGASDDKGPTMAAYYGLKMIKDLELPVSKRARVILGTDEESDWQGMTHYLENENEPDFGFSPDAMFPIINGEKGNFTIHLEIGGNNVGTTRLMSFGSGLRPNMVPQDAEAVLEANNLEEIEASFNDYVAAQSDSVKGEAVVGENDLTLRIIGKSAHGSTPEKGVNAGTYLANFLNQLSLEEDAKTFIDVITNYLHEDPKGEKFNIAMSDETMGELSSNSGIFSFHDGRTGFITINMRYPQGTNEQELEEKFKETLKNENVEINPQSGKEPHYVPGDDPLVTTLLDVYGRQTDYEAHEKVIGGGTYGRLLERGVAFGAMFPDSEDTMHQANEFMEIDDLTRAISIYAEAIYELIK